MSVREQGRGVHRPVGRPRHGGILVFGTALLVAILGFVALAIDVGYMYVARQELRTAADAAALAAAGALGDGGDLEAAKLAAVSIAGQNSVTGTPVTIDPNQDVIFGRYEYNSDAGQWQFVPWAEPYDAVKVVARRTAQGSSFGASPDGPVGLLFARLLGFDNVNVAASAIAKFQARDIALVIDLSGSMTYDSALIHENKLDINMEEVWTALGQPKFGKMNKFNTLYYYSPYYSTSTIKSLLELNGVQYPYPKGSWDEYIWYVRNAWHLGNLGYRNRYGLKTFMDYLLMYRRSHSSTPQLADTPQQPITAVKQAVDIMVEYLKTLDTPEWAAFATFDTYARIEIQLTPDLDQIKTAMWDRQAGHYYNFTNIGDGIKFGHEALTNEYSRPQAFKVMVVFTDGRANRPNGWSYAKQYALQRAQDAAAAGIVIHTITFGSSADKQLMAQIAEIGSGTHYHVEGFNVSQYTQELQEVLLEIAANRPVVLVQ